MDTYSDTHSDSPASEIADNSNLRDVCSADGEVVVTAGGLAIFHLN